MADGEKYTYFVDIDIDNDDDMYAILKSDIQNKTDIVLKHGNSEADVPDNETVKAIKLDKIGEGGTNEDIVDIVNPNPIDFQINKIKWVWIKLG